MPLESATYINGLVASNPTASDQKAQGDDHIRLLKSTLQASFPAVAGAVSASAVELSLMHGLTVQPAAKDGSNLTTPAVGDASTKIATTAFVAATALSATLPGQTGQGGNFLTTDGTTASWKQVYPSMTGNSGKFLTTDGTTASWSNALPAQTGNSGKFLTTDGTNSSWGTPTPVGLVPLGSYTVSSAVANIDFLSTFSSSFDKYVVEIEGVAPSTEDILVILCAKAGAADSGFSYAQAGVGSGGGMVTGATKLQIGSTTNSSVTIEIRNANDAVRPKSIGVRGYGFTASSSSIYYAIAVEGLYLGSNAVTGIRLKWNSGVNFVAGTVRVYGVRN